MHSLSSWRDAHASFERIRHAKVLVRFRLHYTYATWLWSVQRSRNRRRRASLVRAMRQAQDQLEQEGAPSVTARTIAPALEVARRVAGYICTQPVYPAQLPSRVPGEVAFGLANSEDLYLIAAEQLGRLGLGSGLGLGLELAFGLSNGEDLYLIAA